MPRLKKSQIIIFSLLAIIILSLTVLLFFLSPQEIVGKIGIENSYLFAFVIAFLAGFSSLSSFSMTAILITLVIGGVNPVLLGMLSGVALAGGDMLMFLTGSRGRSLVYGNWDRELKKIAVLLEGRPRRFIPLLVYIYMGLTPLPNDLLIVFLAMIKYPLKKLYIAMILGDITYPLTICMLTFEGIVFLN